MTIDPAARAAAIAEYRRNRPPVEVDLAKALGITLEEATRICNQPRSTS